MAEEKARDPTMPERKPVNIPLSKIHDLPGSVFAPPSPKSLEALTSSIVLKGIQEPVILRQREDGEFQIVSGNRRRKASELAKKAEIPAFVYDMTEKEAKEFRFRDKGIGTPPGRLLPESEIGKKREESAKVPEQKKAVETQKTVEAAKRQKKRRKRYLRKRPIRTARNPMHRRNRPKRLPKKKLCQRRMLKSRWRTPRLPHPLKNRTQRRRSRTPRPSSRISLPIQSLNPFPRPQSRIPTAKRRLSRRSRWKRQPQQSRCLLP